MTRITAKEYNLTGYSEGIGKSLFRMREILGLVKRKHCGNAYRVGFTGDQAWSF